MDISIFLAKVMGAYLIIDGVFAILMQKDLIQIFSQVKNKATFLAWGVLASIVGLIIIVSHNIWVGPHQVAISLIGWVVFIKGLLVLFIPSEILELIVSYVNKPVFYNIGGVAAILIGLWLSFFGFVV